MDDVFKMDIKDRKLLALLDENARYSNSQIARKIKLSKPAVEYRINRFEKNDVIFQHYAVIDFTKLGYSQYKIYFKFQNANLEEEQQIINYWINSVNSIWVGQIRGNWDLAVSVLAKSNFEFGRVLLGFMNKYSGFILDKEILLTEYSPIYAREYLEDAKPSEFVYGLPSEKYELDEIDAKILKVLATEARCSIINLAEKTKLTRDIINYRMKKLTKDKILMQYRTYPNLEVIGINLYKIIIRTKNFDKAAENKIKSYIALGKKSVQLLKLIGSWDLEIEYEASNEDELYKYLNDLRKQFADIIRDYDIMRITKTYKYNYYPF
jgi:DNA-binding Lrp family transcriptional regulator